MTTEQRRAMEKGRKRWRREQNKASVKRVVSYRKWVKADAAWWATPADERGPKPRMPEVPTDHDYAVWRASCSA